jgi:hypothetical protein
LSLLAVEKRGSIVPKLTRKPSIHKNTTDVVRIAPVDAQKEKKPTQVKESKAVKAARLDPRHKVWSFPVSAYLYLCLDFFISVFALRFCWSST